MKPIPPDDYRISIAVRHCEAVRFGLTSQQVIKAMSISADLCQRLLCHARKQGLLVLYKLPNGGWCWMVPDDHQSLLGDAFNKREEQRRKWASHGYRRRRNAGTVDSNNRAVDPPDWEIERKYVKADEVPAPKTRAANSVWQWGQV